jgi:hypothetical protein
MRKAVLGSVLLAISVACTGCSSSADGGGTGATGGSGGPLTALSFDADNALPAAGGAAAAIAFATGFGDTISSIFETIASAPAAASTAIFPKQAHLDFSDFCSSGTATLQAPSWPPDTWSSGSQISLNLTACEGSVIAAAAVSGTIALTISGVTVDGPTSGPSIGAAADVELTISPPGETVITVKGLFEVLARVSFGFEDNGRIIFRLGAQRDEDLLTVTDDQVLRLGCFDIDLFVEDLEPAGIAPLGVADLGGQIYTINDYTMTPPLIGFVAGVPISGDMTLYSGDLSAQGSERSGACAEFMGTGDISFVTATFSAGGCIDLNGEDLEEMSFQSSTTWDKLLDRDFTSGSGGVCGGGIPVTCGDVPAGAIEITDSDFQDSNWDVVITQSEGAIVDAQAVRETSGGVDNSAFRRMTHVLENPGTCPDGSCTMIVFHKIGTTYDPSPSGQGAIDYIDYTEAQRVIMPAFEGGAVGWALAVEQAGQRYTALAEVTSFNVTGWTTNGLCELTAADFGPTDGPHPDFSASGGELTFGYTRSNSTSSVDAPQTSVHGIDDFKLVIVKQ